MPDYLTEFEIDSSATLAVDPFELTAASGAYRATIKQLSADPLERSARLRLQLFHSASDFESAEIAASLHARELAELLAVCTSSRFDQPQLTKQIDWSEGVIYRQAAVYTRLGPQTGPDPVLDAGIAITAGLLTGVGASRHIRRATFWYKEGIKAFGPDAKVQAFWLCLETLVSGIKSTGKITDKCIFCGIGKLCCSECGRVSEHRPWLTQRIKLLLRERLKDDDRVYDRAYLARNEIMHGGTLSVQPGQEAWDLEIVNELGEAAWSCLTNELGSSVAPATLKIWKASTYQSMVRRVMSKVWVVMPLINGQPDPENIPVLNVTFENADGDLVIKQSTVSNSRVDVEGIHHAESKGED